MVRSDAKGQLVGKVEKVNPVTPELKVLKDFGYVYLLYLCYSFLLPTY